MRYNSQMDQDAVLWSVNSAPALYISKAHPTTSHEKLIELVKKICKWILTNVTYDVETLITGHTDFNHDFADENDLECPTSAKGDDMEYFHQCPPLGNGNVSKQASVCAKLSPKLVRTGLLMGDGGGYRNKAQGIATCRGYSELFCLLCR